MAKSETKKSQKAKPKAETKTEQKAEKSETTPAPVAKSGKKYDIVSILAIGAICVLIGGAAYTYHLHKNGQSPAFLKSILGSESGSLALDRRNAENAKKTYSSKKYEYKVSFEIDTWENHQKYAKLWGGDLTSITSPEESIIIHQKINEATEKLSKAESAAIGTKIKNESINGFWLGAKHRHFSKTGGSIEESAENASSKEWTWVGGKPWGYGSMLWIRDKYGVVHAPLGGNRNCGLWGAFNEIAVFKGNTLDKAISGEITVLYDEVCTRKHMGIYKRSV